MEIKEWMQLFIHRKSERDEQVVPNRVTPPNRNKLIYYELCRMVVNYKAHEHRLKDSIEGIIKMMQLFRFAKIPFLFS